MKANLLNSKFKIMLIMVLFLSLGKAFGQTNKCNITISSTAMSGGSFTGTAPNRVFTPTASTVNINVSTLQTELQTNNVTISTAYTGGTGAGNVTFSSAVTSIPSSTTQRTFTINAGGDIVVNFAINVSATKASGNAAIPGTSIEFTATGKITTNDLITTMGNTKGNSTGGGSGNISLTAGTNIFIVKAITTTGCTFNSPNTDGGNAGNISITGATGVTISGNLAAVGGDKSGNSNQNGLPGNITINDGATTVTTGGGVNDGQTAGVISGGTLTKTGNGVFRMGMANIYAGTTTINAGSIRLGVANALPSTTSLILNGGTLETGTTTGYEDTMGTLTLSANSAITLGNSAHNLKFSDSSLISWTGSTITVNGWTGLGGASGTAGKLFIGTTNAGLTSAQLAKFQFVGSYVAGAIQLSTGEVVPPVLPNPIINSALTASSTYGTAGTYTITGQYFPSTFNATGLPTGMTLNSSTGVITVASTTAAGTYSITISATNTSGTGSATLVYTISKKNLTITANNQNVIYGSTVATVTGAGSYTATGFANSDTASVISGLATYTTTYTQITNAGTTGIVITPVITSLTASNYSFTAVNGTVTIGVATPVVTVTVGSYTYTGSAIGPNASTNTGVGTTYTYSYTGTGATTYGPSATRPTNAGTYTVTATVAASGNYGVGVSPATAFTIGVAIPVVTATIGSYTFTGSAVGPNTATNTGTGSSYTYNYVGTDATTYGPSTTRPTNAGTYTVIATVAANGNFSSASSSATAFTIGVATPVVTVTVGSYTYNGTSQGPNVATNTGTGTSYTYSYVGTGATTYTASATAPTNAGTYTVTVTVAADGNYASASSSARAFTIAKATPVVTLAVGNYTYSGIGQGPNNATNTGTSTVYTYAYVGTNGTTYASSSKLPINVGSYTVVATVAADSNYNSASTIIQTFTIDKANLVIKANDVLKDFYLTYKFGTTAFTATGLVNNETIGGVTLTSSGAVYTAMAGVYDIVISAAVGGTFKMTNYNVTYVNGALTVHGSFSVAGTLSGGSRVCKLSNSNVLALSGYEGSVVQWEFAISPFTKWKIIANTSTTYVNVNTTQNTRFRALIKNGFAPAIYSNETEVSIASTTWSAGAWSNGRPTATTSAVISDTYTSQGNNDVLEACALTVNNKAKVTILPQDSVVLSGVVTVTTGSTLLFSNNSNLIQTGTTNLNAGNIQIMRNTLPLKRLDFVLWSSPVGTQVLQKFSPNTNSDSFYNYDTNSATYKSVLKPLFTNFTDATGYMIRMPNTHPTTSTAWTGVFTGKPNNGDYSYPMVYSDNARFNLIGNPYPSTIDADAFISANSDKITGALYFWRKTNGTDVSSYCTYTTQGGFVSNGEAVLDGINNTPANIIQVGQGFLVEAKAAGKVNFKNSMRVNNHSDRFLRKAPVEKNRIWLNASNSSGYYSQTMVGYIGGATNGIDQDIDGRNINSGDITFASLIDNDSYAIQGRTLPFDNSDVVPMNFSVANSGNYTIAIDHVDGLFSGNQEIYLRDNVAGTVHDLKTGGYKFTSASGVFANRFEILYQKPLEAAKKPATIEMTSTEFDVNNVVIYTNQVNDVVINTKEVMMSNVKIFDIQGKLLVEKNDVNDTLVSVSVNLSDEILLVQIASQEGKVVTKKFIYKRTSLKRDKEIKPKTQLAEDE